MSDGGKIKYVWVIEWENSFSQQDNNGIAGFF
jgi:hypothetical protein